MQQQQLDEKWERPDGPSNLYEDRLDFYMSQGITYDEALAFADEDYHLKYGDQE